jgi:proteic killer suppression protein
MIRSFGNRDTAALAEGLRVKKFQAFAEQARTRLRRLEAATSLEDLRVLPSNRLHALRSDRLGQWSISINRQWRICFEWRNGAAWNVEIVDYH